uniref:Small RNA 2'-O-methyltransferase n=1 Tax=Ciona savignyi TaxID=51511 RepID=H2YXS7_CIOSA
MCGTRAAENEASMGVTFEPKLYVQRYNKVLELLSRLRPEKVVDLGCAECKLINLLRHEDYVKEISGVDLDGSLLRGCSHKLDPQAYDFLNKRFNPLTIRLYQGSVSEFDERLRNYDAVVSIELIEHLLPKTLEDFPQAVFGYINPKTVIISTPNADFNVLFGLNGCFRHWDHKFEWTRKQFQSWCENICKDYQYSVEYDGVGVDPDKTQNFGYCSQFAIFTKLQDSRTHFHEPANVKSFQLVSEAVYPFQSKADQINDKLHGNVLRCVGLIVTACVLAAKPKFLLEKENNNLPRTCNQGRQIWENKKSREEVMQRLYKEVEIGQFSDDDANTTEEKANSETKNIYNFPRYPPDVVPQNRFRSNYFHKLRQRYTDARKVSDTTQFEDGIEKSNIYEPTETSPICLSKFDPNLRVLFKFYSGNLHTLNCDFDPEMIHANDTYTRIPLIFLCKHYLMENSNADAVRNVIKKKHTEGLQLNEKEDCIIVQNTEFNQTEDSDRSSISSLDNLCEPLEDCSNTNFNERNWDSE